MFRPGLINPRAALSGLPICHTAAPLDFLADSEEPCTFQGGVRRVLPPG